MLRLVEYQMPRRTVERQMLKTFVEYQMLKRIAEYQILKRIAEHQMVQDFQIDWSLEIEMVQGLSPLTLNLQD